MPSVVSSMVHVVEEDRVVDVEPHGLEGWRIDSSHGTKNWHGKDLCSTQAAGWMAIADDNARWVCVAMSVEAGSSWMVHDVAK